jgi:hypothetical protein
MSTLEERVAALEAAIAARPAPATSDRSGGDDFWLLDQLRTRHPNGAIVFGGTVTAGKQETAWQWGVDAEPLCEQDWTPAAARLDALSHPVRLRLLQRVLNGASSTAELADDPTLGTTGQLHHHLRALVAGGWLASSGRATWAVPPARVVPLLVVLSAALG